MIATECTIEEILGKSLDELLALSQEDLLKLLEPSLKMQEQIFLEMKSKKKPTPTPRSSRTGLSSVDSVVSNTTPINKPVTATQFLKQGMSTQQATIAALTASGVKITPELLEALKGKKPT